MTTITENALVIDAQDLTTVSPGSQDHDGLYQHDGSTSITLVDGSTTSNQGYYLWDNTSGAWIRANDRVVTGDLDIPEGNIEVQNGKILLSGDLKSLNHGARLSLDADSNANNSLELNATNDGYVSVDRNNDTTNAFFEVGHDGDSPADTAWKGIARFVEGGNAEIPNGSLTVKDALKAAIVNGVRYVGANGFSTIQDALDDIAATSGTTGNSTVSITDSYDPTNETWPVTVDGNHLGTIIEGQTAGEIAIDSGQSGAFKIKLKNTRPPGFYMRDLSITDTNPGTGPPTINMIDAKFCVLENVNIDHNLTGSADAFYMDESGDTLSDGTSDSYTPNSNTFIACDVEQVGGAGFHFMAGSHSTLLTDCRVKDVEAEGLYLHGLSYQVDWSGGQIEDCDAPGVRIQKASNVNIVGTYFEANGQNASGGQQSEIKTQNGAGNVYVNNCWFHGFIDSQDNLTPRIYYQDTSGTVEVGHIRYNDEYDNVFQLVNGTFTYHPQHLVAANKGDPTVMLIDPNMKKIFQGELLVGSGSNNYGTDDLGGVDVGLVEPDQLGQRAMANGTTAAGVGIICTGIPDQDTTDTDNTLAWRESHDATSTGVIQT